MNNLGKYVSALYLVAFSGVSAAELVRFDFTGEMLFSQYGSNWNAGDSIYGYYQFETDSSYRVYNGLHYYDQGDWAINDFYVNIGGDEYFGDSGYIAIQNDSYLEWSSSYHDRYIATMFTTEAPDVSYFQIDFEGRNPDGPVNIVDSTNLVPYLPNYLLDSQSGRLRLPDNQQPRFTISSMEATAVPLPSSVLLFASGLLGVFLTRLRSLATQG